MADRPPHRPRFHFHGSGRRWQEPAWRPATLSQASLPAKRDGQSDCHLNRTSQSAPATCRSTRPRRRWSYRSPELRFGAERAPPDQNREGVGLSERSRCILPDLVQRRPGPQFHDAIRRIMNSGTLILISLRNTGREKVRISTGKGIPQRKIFGLSMSFRSVYPRSTTLDLTISAKCLSCRTATSLSRVPILRRVAWRPR